jgi:hypothetical protein
MGLLKTLNLKNFVSPRQREREEAHRQAIENELVWARREAEEKALEAEQERQKAKQERERARLQEQERQHREAERIRLEAERRAQENMMQAERRAKIEKVKKARLRKLQEASPETLRSLRELIREKYELDVQIWARRGARRPDRGIVLDKMDKADATMEEILGMLALWGDNKDGSWRPLEWERVEAIRERLQHGGHRNWADGPPWEV